MHLALRVLAVAVFTFLTGSFSFAQPSMEDIKEEFGDKPLKVFLDCGSCDMNFLREKISYIHYVRDPEQSDIHVLVTTQRSGNNARSYVFDFMGKGLFASEKHQLEFMATPTATREEERQGVAQKLELGLVPFWIQTKLSDEMGVSVNKPGKVKPAVTQDDPWNNWIFELAGGGAFSKESSRSNVVVWGSVEANRVTPEWRLRNRGFIRHEQRVFKEDEGDIISQVDRKYVNSSVVKSLADHWSAGLFGSVSQNSFSNIDLGISVMPAFEYSIFSYDDVNRRELTIAYRVGYTYRDYQEMTIYQKMEESLWRQSINLTARFRQPWGSLFAGVEGSHFFDDLSKHRLETDVRLNLRILSGLALQLGGDLALIKDQRSLRAGETSLEDLLLAQTQLATNYRFSGSIGLSYTFGSMFNNVVNTRL